MSDYPEHTKMEKHEEKRLIIGDFLTWLKREGFFIAESRYHLKKRRADDPDDVENQLADEQLVNTPLDTEELLAHYLDIDLEKIEEEKQEMLREAREND